MRLGSVHSGSIRPMLNRSRMTFGFAGRAAFANAKIVADIGYGDMRRQAFVEGKVDGSDGVDDAGRPIFSATAGQGRRPFPTQFRCHHPAHIGILFVEFA